MKAGDQIDNYYLRAACAVTMYWCGRKEDSATKAVSIGGIELGDNREQHSN
jgi:hypothetical protein